MFTKMAAKLEKIIIIPEHVEVHIENNLVKLKGPKGHTEKKLKHPAIIIKSENNTIHLIADNDSKKEKRVINTFAAHIKNLITGVKEGYQYTLKICSGHFPMTVTVSDNKLHVKNFLGEKVSRVLALKQGASVKVDGALIHVSSASKELAGQVSGDIEQLMRRPGFDNRVFQDGIYIINKDGKELK